MKALAARLAKSLKLAAKKPVKKRRKRMPTMASATARIPHPANSSTIVSGAATQVWTIWNRSYTGTTTTLASSVTTGTGNQIIWDAWTSGSITTSGSQAGTQTGTQLIMSGSNTTTWGIWNDTHEVKLATAEEQQRLTAERQRANAEYHARQQALQAETAAAQTRALRLLRENLDEKQKSDLSANGFFELETISKNGERRKYRIHRKWSGNIQQVDDNGKRIKTLCIHPREATPIEDSMLAQKLMLEGGAEEDLLRIANHS